MVKNRFYRFIRATWRPFATFLHPLRVEGLENLPKDQPVLLCANHSSAVDPILLICAMRQDFPLRIMAKKQLMKIPVVGAFLRAIGVFGVDRGNSDIAAVKTSIQSWPFAPACRWCRGSSAGTSACFTGCPSSSESPMIRYIPAGRERRRSISPTPRRSCVGPMR